MLLLEDGEAPFQRRDLGDVRAQRLVEDAFNGTLEDALPDLAPPLREHERVDVEGVGDILYLDIGLLAEADGLQFEVELVPADFRWTCCSSHRDTFFRLGLDVHFPGSAVRSA